MELLIIDGLSDDDTLEQVAEFDSAYNDIDIQIFTNQRRTAPHGLNLGIAKAKGDIILRFDGHAIMAPDYVSNCVQCLEQTGAANVGGPMLAVGSSITGKAIALAHQLPFGLGGGAFHSDFEGFADTVYLGCYPREILARYGLYDTRLTRNQDIELNARIRKGLCLNSEFRIQNSEPGPGGIYLTPRIKSLYHCRSTLSGLWKQNFANGQWVVYTKYIAPYALSLRHFIPLLFVSSLLILSVLSLSGLGSDLWGRWAGSRLANLLHGVKGLGLKQPGLFSLKAWSWHLLFLRLLALELFAYFGAMLLFVVKAGGNREVERSGITDDERTGKGEERKAGGELNFPASQPLSASLALLPLVFMTLHFSYGLGSLWGLLTLPFRRTNNNP
jgi:glycosyltransferase involved in cell wall biosynthesis